jgi:predicted component of type VI protein secretion system
MEVKLRVLSGKSAGQELPVSVPRFVIGRAEGCQLRARSESIGERHCEIEVGPGLVRIHDLGSPTATFVNGERLSSASRELKIGDRLKIGPLEFEVCMSVKLATKKKPAVGSIGEAAARLAGSKREDLDLDQLLAGGDDDPPTPSRYAAQLTEQEKSALGINSVDSPASPAGDESNNGTKPPAKGKPTADVDTHKLAADVLNKYKKHR